MVGTEHIGGEIQSLFEGVGGKEIRSWMVANLAVLDELDDKERGARFDEIVEELIMTQFQRAVK